MILREIEFCSNMDLSSGLEIRSTPCVASSASCHSIATFARSNSAEDTISIKNGLSEQRSSSNGHIGKLKHMP